MSSQPKQPNAEAEAIACDETRREKLFLEDGKARPSVCFYSPSSKHPLSLFNRYFYTMSNQTPTPVPMDDNFTGFRPIQPSGTSSSSPDAESTPEKKGATGGFVPLFAVAYDSAKARPTSAGNKDMKLL